MVTVGAVLGWAAVASASHAEDVTKYYVSLGDSYAAGYRPIPEGHGSTSRDGFAYRVEEALRERDGAVRLANFACSGTSAYGMSFDEGCAEAARAPDGEPYSGIPQSVAAIDFIEQQRDRIALVTIAVGGNDVLRCLSEPDAPSMQSCAETEMPRVRLSLDATLARIRAAVGDGVPVIGLSYINVYLAEPLTEGADGVRRAEAATTLFDNYLNPVLAEIYSRYGAQFIDVTALAGGHLPPTEKTWLPGRGTVSASVGRVCSLTYFCTVHDPHPNRAGHDFIAGEIAKALGV